MDMAKLIKAFLVTRPSTLTLEFSEGEVLVEWSKGKRPITVPHPGPGKWTIDLLNIDEKNPADWPAVVAIVHESNLATLHSLPAEALDHMIEHGVEQLRLRNAANRNPPPKLH